MIGFFYAFVCNTIGQVLYNNRLLKFYFRGTYFGIGNGNIKTLIMKNQVDTIYRQAERFAEITQKAIVSGNINRAKKCLALAEQLFATGSNETKNAISNVYVFSVSSFMESRHCSISNLFPKLLKAEYIKQINASGV